MIFRMFSILLLSGCPAFAQTVVIECKTPEVGQTYFYKDSFGGKFTRRNIEWTGPVLKQEMNYSGFRTTSLIRFDKSKRIPLSSQVKDNSGTVLGQFNISKAERQCGSLKSKLTFIKDWGGGTRLKTVRTIEGPMSLKFKSGQHVVWKFTDIAAGVHAGAPDSVRTEYFDPEIGTIKMKSVLYQPSYASDPEYQKKMLKIVEDMDFEALKELELEQSGGQAVSYAPFTHVLELLRVKRE